MIDKRLSPVEAVGAAKAVYLTREAGKKNGRSISGAFGGEKVSEYFDFSDGGSSKISAATRLHATTGAIGFYKHQTSSVFAEGVSSGYEKHAILVCRGTDGGHDWLTDINTKPASSLTGHTVHSGFNQAFNCFRKELLECVERSKSNVLHCVGHSLGGAMANLAADTVASANLNTKVILYTFGAPRIGTFSFANKLSQHNKVIDIFRVYHGGDPVSMVPLWPFVHAPQPGGECYIGKFSGFNPWQHKVGAYEASVIKAENFDVLRRNHPSVSGHIGEWLTSPEGRKYVGLNAYNLMMLNKAIALIVKRVMSCGWNAVGGIAYAGMTMTDQLAILFDKAQKISSEDSSLVLGLMRRMINMAGLNIKEADNLSAAFIKRVLRMFMAVLGHSVASALRAGSMIAR